MDETAPPPYATPDDVATRLGRPLTGAEPATVAALLIDAETIVRTGVPDLDQRVTTGRLPVAVIRLVLVTMVLRVVRNPSGYRSETAGDYSYTVDARTASGALVVTADEWRLLGIGDGAFTIAPTGRRSWVDGWPPDPMNTPAGRPAARAAPTGRYRPRRGGGW